MIWNIIENSYFIIDFFFETRFIVEHKFQNYQHILSDPFKMKNLILCISITFLLGFSIFAKPAKPNVLFFMSDDLNTALSGFGHPQCKTPELDKLARRGIRFENMHCQYPVCGASRASLMSGLYPYTNGTRGQWPGTLRGNMPDVVTMSQFIQEKWLPGWPSQ